MRNIGLDLLRIIAIFLVIGRHLHLPEDSGIFMRAWARGGWIGVDLFFVLSGFLVSSLLFREHLRKGTINTKRFLIRRGFKIYPAFWLFLIVSLLVRLYQGERSSIKQIIGEVFFFQNYLGGIWNHTWSLAVEEHFYIGLALLVTCLVTLAPARPFHRLPLIFCFVAGLCLAFRVTNLFLYPEFSHKKLLFGTHIRMDSLMFGVLLSYLWNFCDFEKRISRIPSVVLMGVGITLLSPAFVFPLESNRWMCVIGFAMFYVGSGFLLVAAIRLKDTNFFVIRCFAALGAASYSIYLWHMPVATWGHELMAMALGFDNQYLYLFNAIVGACLFGWVLNRLIENPVLLVRDRLFPSHTLVAPPGELSSPRQQNWVNPDTAPLPPPSVTGEGRLGEVAQYYRAVLSVTQQTVLPRAANSLQRDCKLASNADCDIVD